MSPKTVDSYWVPFEVGYGYEKIDLGILTLKGIQDEELPDYMRTTDVVRGIRSLNNLIAELLGESKSHLERKGDLIKESNLEHPLDDILNWSL